MSYQFTVYDWSMYTLPSDIPAANLVGDIQANDPNAVGYNSAAPTWIGQQFTFNGGSGTGIVVNDDDDTFDDGYVEQGGAQTLAQPVTINGVTYRAGAVLENEFSLVDNLGNEVYILRIDGQNVGFVYASNNPPQPGENFSASTSRNGDAAHSSDSVSSSQSYATMDDRTGIVEGTDQSDSIDSSYTGDPDGDMIDGGNGYGPNHNGDIVYAGGGDDQVFSGLGNDTVYGGSGADYIDGGDGNDSLDGGFGNDTLHGDAGNDSIDGGAGDDQIYGGDGDDSLNGGDGADVMHGGYGADVIDGGLGNDRIYGDGGNDTINGGDGNDTIHGGNDNDLIDGGAGSDHLYGDTGDDTVLGGAGDDSLYLGAGNDSLHGGAGSDYFIAHNGFGNDTVVGGEDGGEYDVLDFRGYTQGVSVTYTGTEAGTASSGTDTVTFSEIEALMMTQQADYVDGSASSGPMLVAAGGGDDTVIGGSGNDGIAGEAGNDRIEGNAGDDSIDAGAGNDTVFGGSGNDLIYGQSGADSLDGGDGNDTIYGGTENDTIHGGAGADVLLGEGGDDRIEGGDGNDQISGGAGHDRIEGNAGNDTITGDAGNDAIYGGSGDDSISGGTGDDHLIGGEGADSIDGGDGNDYLHGDGQDRYTTTNNPPPSDPSAPPVSSNDTLTGGAGNDTLDGGAGDDVLTGGAGNDYFFVSEGHDTVTDFGFGNTGAIGDGDSSNNDFLNLGAYYDSLDELRADQADDGILNQSNTTDDEGNTVDYSDNARFAPNSSMTVQGASEDSYTYDNTGIVCFAAGTHIMTPRGEVLIESLRPGDLVNTADHGPQPLLWIGQRHVCDAELTANEELRPVMITKGALGNNRDLLVSRQHGMMVGDDHLVRAIHLARDMSGVRIANGKREVTYVHLFFAQHEIVFAEGIASESFYPGPTALRMLSAKSRAELNQLVPALADGQGAEAVQTAYGPTARPFAKLSEISPRRIAA